MISFFIPGPPVAWARARRAGNRYFVDEKTAAAKRAIASAAKAAGAKVATGPLAIWITVYIEKPKRRKDAYPTSRPDADNYAKLVMDALNGVAWTDDALVVSLHVDKQWSGESGPCTTITIGTMS